MRFATSDRLAAGLALAGLAGCATPAPPLPPPPSQTAMIAGASAGGAAPWAPDGAPPPPSPPAAARRPEGARTRPPTRTERYWGWCLLADVVGLGVLLGTLPDESATPWAVPVAALPAGVVHLAHLRPGAALLASAIRASGYLVGRLVFDRVYVAGDARRAVGAATLAGSIMGLTVGLAIALDGLALARREVAVEGWHRLPVLPSVGLVSGRLSLDFVGTF